MGFLESLQPGIIGAVRGWTSPRRARGSVSPGLWPAELRRGGGGGGGLGYCRHSPPEIRCCWGLVCWRGFLGASRLIPCHLLESPCPSSSLQPLEPALAPLPFNAGYFPIYSTNYFPAFAPRISLSPEILMFYFPSKTSSFSVCHHNLVNFGHP